MGCTYLISLRRNRQTVGRGTEQTGVGVQDHVHRHVGEQLAEASLAAQASRKAGFSSSERMRGDMPPRQVYTAGRKQLER